MAILALILGVLLLIPLVFDVSDSTENALDAIGWIIWGVFVVEYLLLLWVSDNRWQMVKSHPLELLLILIPILRPLRLLHLLRALAGVGVGMRTMRGVASRSGLQWYLVFTLLVVVAGASLTLAAERQVDDAEITTFADALWWAVVTCTTVGYGDFAPVSPAGRGVAVALMLLGVSLVSVVTANIASFMVEQETEAELADVMNELRDLHRKLDRLLPPDHVGP